MAEGTARSPSFWLDPPPEPGPPLEGDLEVDCVIVGAGYTGLSAALALSAEGLEVAVLERDYAGFGASGRNAGHLTPTIGKDLPTLLRLYGRERARKLVQLAERAVERVEALISEHAIECDYVAAGNVVAGMHPGQAAALERAADTGRELGASLLTLSPTELDERGLPAAVACGYLEERGGVLNPGKYVRGLRAAALERGVRLFESTRVATIVDGSPVRVETPRGQVTAPQCVLATNAYTPELGWLRSVATPLRVSLFVTEPLSAEARARVGWAGGEGIYTAHEVLESYRLTADGRIVGGSRYVRYSERGRPFADQDPSVFEKLEAMFRRRFPELAETAVERCWSGPIMLALDFLPAIGRTGRNENVLYSLAYAGHGVALASYAGTLLARMATGGEAGVPELTERFRVPLPPEPLRRLVARGLIAGFEAMDRRTDRRAEPRGGASREELASVRLKVQVGEVGQVGEGR